MSQFQRGSQKYQSQKQQQPQQQQQQQKRPCCKVCMDAGKSEKEYSSHWVKDTQGAVICPTLLGQKCRYCDKSGHTVKFCLEIEKTQKYKEKCAREMVARDEYEMQRVEVGVDMRNEKNKGSAAAAIGPNKWAALDDGDSDEDTTIKKKNVSKCDGDFPQLSLAPKMQQQPTTTHATPTLSIASAPVASTQTWASKAAAAGKLSVKGPTTIDNKVEHQILVSNNAGAVGVRNLEYRDASLAFTNGLKWGKAASKKWEDMEEDEDEEEYEY
jgi:hypothetical protein